MRAQGGVRNLPEWRWRPWRLLSKAKTDIRLIVIDFEEFEAEPILRGLN